MAVTFDGINRIIEVNNPADVALDAERDIYSEWKRWALIGNNGRFAPAFTQDTVFGGNPTITNQFAPKYFFLTNFWRIFINNGQVVSIGLNLYSEDYSSPYIVASGSGVSDRNSDAVSVNDELIQFSSFSNRVTIDQNNITGNATSGITFPTGTYQRPVNNLADAKVIATVRGFSEIFVIGDLNIDDTANFSRFTFIGESSLKTNITITENATIADCEFLDATIEGYLDGNCQIDRAVITNLNFVNGLVFRCSLGPSPIKLSGSGLISNFFSCYSTIPGVSTPIIDGNGNGSLALRDYHGGMLLTNFSDINQSHSIDLSSGQIKLDLTTVTAGVFVFRGVGKLVDMLDNIIVTGTYGDLTIVNELLTAGDIGGGGNSPWSEAEKDEVLQYSKKASDNAEQANLKL